MSDVSEIVEELEWFGVPNERAHLFAAKLIVIGEKAALYRATKGVLQSDQSTTDCENIIAFRAVR